MRVVEIEVKDKQWSDDSGNVSPGEMKQRFLGFGSGLWSGRVQTCANIEVSQYIQLSWHNKHQ